MELTMLILCKDMQKYQPNLILSDLMIIYQYFYLFCFILISIYMYVGYIILVKQR